MESMVLSMLRAAVPRATTVVYVEGNVGSGKTAVMAAMRDSLKKDGHAVIVLAEDTECWEHAHLLTDMYARPGDRGAKRAFEALGPLRQYIERAHFIERCGSKWDYIILERHPTTTLEVFGADKAVRALFETIQACYPFMDLPKTTIYVKASPATCLQRVKKRNRECERGLDLEFLTDLDKKHGLMMLARRTGGRVVVSVDANHRTAAEMAEEACAALK